VNAAEIPGGRPNEAADNQEVDTTVLVIDDEASIRKTLAVDLRARGYNVVLADDATEGIRQFRVASPDVVLLDLGLPDMDGIEVIKELRLFSQSPIIVLSVRGEESDKVAALDAGADDYVSKPFGIHELLARMRAALRRTGDRTDPIVHTAHFDLDLSAQTAVVDGAETRLTPIEWGLVRHLVTRPGRLVPRRLLLQAVWGHEYQSETNYLRVHLANLRHKLEPNPASPVYFITEPGIGYRFQPDR
jgi:two-component system KDP operon response regulator KdpE